MSATARIVAPFVLEHTCDHQGSTQLVGQWCRCSACGTGWSPMLRPTPQVWLEYLKRP